MRRGLAVTGVGVTIALLSVVRHFGDTPTTLFKMAGSAPSKQAACGDSHTNDCANARNLRGTFCGLADQRGVISVDVSSRLLRRATVCNHVEGVHSGVFQ